MIEPVRRRLAGEPTALALPGTDADTPAEALRRRAGAHVLVSGHGRLAVPIAAALAEAGVGTWTRVDRPRRAGGYRARPRRRRGVAVAGEAVMRDAPHTTLRPLPDGTATFVVQAGGHRPAELTALAYARRRLPHLSVELRDRLAVVGPLVTPAGSPCLNCLDLHRRDRDPTWPALAAQLSTGQGTTQPCAATTALIAVGYVADEVLTFIDGGARRPSVPRSRSPVRAGNGGEPGPPTTAAVAGGGSGPRRNQGVTRRVNEEQ